MRVVVPARDEERLVAGCLDALARAVTELQAAYPGVRCTTTVVLDACRDRTETVVAAYGSVARVVSGAGVVGAARAQGIDMACRDDDPHATWVATTDADTVVPAHWLTTQLEFATRGYDLVVGTVVPRGDDVDPGTLERWRARHRLTERHEHVHGANLGFRLAAYREAGGYQPVALAEDLRLVEAMRRTSHRHVATARTQVVTSGRREARAIGGFAAYLNALRADDPAPMAGGPDLRQA